MSKFFASNNYSIYKSALETAEKSLFQVSYKYENVDECVFVYTTSKLLVVNINHYSCRAGFIILCGTYAPINEESIELYDLFDLFDGEVDSIRNLLFGNYAAYIYKDNKIFSFTEKSACHNLYYYSSEEDWCISTSLYDLSETLRESLTVNRLNLLEEISRYMIVNNETYYNEVFRLAGDEFLTIDHNRLIIEQVPLVFNSFTVEQEDDNIKRISTEIIKVATSMKKKFGDPTLGATGGLDSRISLAAYLAAGSKPKLTYGMGNSFLAPSMSGDKEIDEKFRDMFNLEFELSPWNETVPLDKKWKEFTEKYGFVVYSGNEDAYNFYLKDNEPFVIFGYMGEFFREFDWLSNIKNDYVTIEQYVDHFHIEPNIGLFKSFPELYQHVLNKWISFCKRKGLNPNRIKKEDLCWINLEYRQKADSQMLNFINLFKYSHYLLSEYNILSQSCVPIESKYNAGYMLKLINELFPNALDVPIFSHSVMQTFNRREMKLEPLKKSYLVKAKSILPYKLKIILKEKGIYKNKAMDNYVPVYDLLNDSNNRIFVEKLFGCNDLSFIKANPDPTFLVSTIYLGKYFEKLGLI